ncbi:uncharacterized protein LOC129230166 [Uloborus diversus]|uniref:uncharacterized protein LOC129230166 n=1 Tax=Uloborus diversus TaxID=327109 RepID=UPI00240A9A8C|nr:uncharacterized protein LOC129230166 [Uloborus diversus]
MVKKEDMPLAKYREEIAICLCKLGKTATGGKRGRPSTSEIETQLQRKKQKGPAAAMPVKDVRLDGNPESEEINIAEDDSFAGLLIAHDETSHPITVLEPLAGPSVALGRVIGANRHVETFAGTRMPPTRAVGQAEFVTVQSTPKGSQATLRAAGTTPQGTKRKIGNSGSGSSTRQVQEHRRRKRSEAWSSDEEEENEIINIQREIKETMKKNECQFRSID